MQTVFFVISQKNDISSVHGRKNLNYFFWWYHLIATSLCIFSILFIHLTHLILSLKIRSLCNGKEKWKEGWKILPILVLKDTWNCCRWNFLLQSCKVETEISCQTTNQPRYKIYKNKFDGRISFKIYQKIAN